MIHTLLEREPPPLKREIGAKDEERADDAQQLKQHVRLVRLQGMGWGRLTLALAARAAVNPPLAGSLVRVIWRFRRRKWYRRWPFLPLPSRDYLRWRMHTAYGDHDAVPPVKDVVRYARWAVKSP
jgi:hypothetical protein